jgi:hypothetical protein
MVEIEEHILQVQYNPILNKKTLSPLWLNKRSLPNDLFHVSEEKLKNNMSMFD